MYEYLKKLINPTEERENKETGIQIYHAQREIKKIKIDKQMRNQEKNIKLKQKRKIKDLNEDKIQIVSEQAQQYIRDN